MNDFLEKQINELIMSENMDKWIKQIDKCLFKSK